jgi:hypothetical protein
VGAHRGEADRSPPIPARRRDLQALGRAGRLACRTVKTGCARERPAGPPARPISRTDRSTVLRSDIVLPPKEGLALPGTAPPDVTASTADVGFGHVAEFGVRRR